MPRKKPTEIATETEEVLVVDSMQEAAEVGRNILEPTSIKETVQSETERMKTALNINRNKVRVLLSGSFIKEAVPGIEKLLSDANSGKMRAADQIKLYDMLLKYSVGMVQSTEISGEDGSAVKVEYMFGTSPESKQSALDYLARVREQQAKEQAVNAEFSDLNTNAQQEPAERQSLSDNEHSDN